MAVILNRIDVIEKLILTDRVDLNASNKDGNTPLHFAVLYSKMDVIEKLLNHGTKTDIKNHSKKTVLELVRKEGLGVL